AAVGLAGGESAYIAMGDGVTVAAANGAFLLNPVLGGLRDLVAYKSSTTGPGPSDRMLLLRDQDPAVGVGSLDFGGPNAATPASAAMQVLGANAGATTSQTMAFLTGASCDFSLLYSASSVPDTGFTASGAPAALLRPSDFHQLVVSTIDAGGTSFRTVAESFNQMAPRVLTFGDPLPALSVVTLSGAYLRLQATASPPTEYQSNAFLSYSAAVGGTTHLASIVASSGWLGGSSATLIMPDLSDIPAFDAKAPPPPSSSGRWTFTAAGMSGGSACTEGSRTVTATRTGIF
ncbi:MAG TPA: hypothetical protein VFU23_12090, partial [Gemmatimonadales bacterium]|nr:hypothetical protein [Gemmatimonadales bacterium]